MDLVFFSLRNNFLNMIYKWKKLFLCYGINVYFYVIFEKGVFVCVDGFDGVG